VGAQSFTAAGGTLVDNYGRWHYESWGDPGDTLTASGLTAAASGEHLVQVEYGNGAGDISTGITCAVKRVEVIDQATSSVVGSGLLVMPHLGAWDRWANSSFVPVILQAGHTYDVVISHDAHSLNMSDFEHNALYGGTGGSAGAFHHVNISEIKLLALTAP
jgi:hypothetical protein